MSAEWPFWRIGNVGDIHEWFIIDTTYSFLISVSVALNLNHWKYAGSYASKMWRTECRKRSFRHTSSRSQCMNGSPVANAAQTHSSNDNFVRPRPQETLKNSLCSKRKSSVEQMDRPYVIFECLCDGHDGKKCSLSYVGQTRNAPRESLSQHRNDISHGRNPTLDNQLLYRTSPMQQANVAYSIDDAT